MHIFLKYPQPEARKTQLGKADYSYPEVGFTKKDCLESLNNKYNIDRYQETLGSGNATFEKAKKSLKEWKHFDLGWAHIAAGEPKQQQIVSVVVKVFGIWTLNHCKVVYIIDEEHRWGFAYGTLKSHGESGEERFMLYHNPQTDIVSFEILAFSKPQHWLAKLTSWATARPPRA